MASWKKISRRLLDFALAAEPGSSPIPPMPDSMVRRRLEEVRAWNARVESFKTTHPEMAEQLDAYVASTVPSDIDPKADSYERR